MKRNLGEIYIHEINELNKLEKYIEDILDYYNIPGEYFGNIMLATSESAELILKRRKGKCSIGIRVSRNPKGISFEFRAKHPEEDELLDDLEVALERQQFMRETFIIRTLADKTEIARKGHSLKLHFEIAGINYERSLRRSERLRQYFTEKTAVRDTK